MNKRGQIYILAAIIIIFAIYVISTKQNAIMQIFREDNFERLTENYDVESAKFMNALLTEKTEDVRGMFLGFTVYYTSYSKAQNKDFGLIYAFDYQGVLHMANYLEENLVIQSINSVKAKVPPLTGCYEYVTPGSIQTFSKTPSGFDPNDFVDCTLDYGVGGDERYPVSFSIGGITYDAMVTSGIPEIIVVGKQEREKDVKVYLRGDLNGVYQGADAMTSYCNRYDDTDCVDGTDGICKWSGNICIINCQKAYEGANLQNNCEESNLCCWDSTNEVCKDKGQC